VVRPRRGLGRVVYADTLPSTCHPGKADRNCVPVPPASWVRAGGTVPAAARPPHAGGLRGLAWAAGKLLRVLARFPAGYFFFKNERPTWRIRFAHALGCVEGAARLLLARRAR
jgi:hypothetical protein